MPFLVARSGAGGRESGWGTSRFSHEGNNIFGLRTQSGTGMIPQERPDQESYAVSTFEDLQSCIDYYLWNINTNPLYEDLRRIRSRSARQCGGLDLARGLVCYSEQGPAYVSKLEKLISANSLSEYDGYRLKDVQARMPPNARPPAYRGNLRRPMTVCGHARVVSPMCRP
jgi:Bax protein